MMNTSCEEIRDWIKSIALNTVVLRAENKFRRWQFFSSVCFGRGLQLYHLLSLALHHRRRRRRLRPDTNELRASSAKTQALRAHEASSGRLCVVSVVMS